MTGSLVVKRDIYHITINHKDAQGKWKKKWISTGLSVHGNNKRRAEKLLKDALDEFEKQASEVTSDVLLVDYLDSWKEVARVKVDANTMEGYEQLINSHIRPYFEEKQCRLVDVSTKMIQQFYGQKMIDGRIRGKGGLSANTIKHFHAVIRQVMSAAEKDGLIAKNPCDNVELPRIQQYQAKFYNVDEVKHLLDCCPENQPITAIVLLTAYYGLRRSEVMGLRWKAIDFDNEALRIEHVAVRNKTRMYKSKTKNLSSKRSYPLLDEIKSLLLKIRARQQENKALLGTAYHDSDYVFVWDDGTLISPDYASRTFGKVLKANGLRTIRFHDLRHSCASILISMGYGLKDVQEWLGHSDISVTGNIYAHLETKRKTEMAKQFAQKMIG